MMRKKKFFVILMALIFNNITWGMPLGKMLFDSSLSAIEELFFKLKFTPAEKLQIKASLAPLFERASSADEVENYLRTLRTVHNQDTLQRARALRLLHRNLEGDLTDFKNELIDFSNYVAYIEGRFGGHDNRLLACLNCFEETTPLVQEGYRFSFGEIESPSIRYLLKNQIPKAPEELDKTISLWATSLNIKYHSYLPFLVDPSLRKHLALFMAIGLDAKEGPFVSMNMERELFAVIIDFYRINHGFDLQLAEDTLFLWGIFGQRATRLPTRQRVNPIMLLDFSIFEKNHRLLWKLFALPLTGKGYEADLILWKEVIQYAKKLHIKNNFPRKMAIFSAFKEIFEEEMRVSEKIF